MCTWSKISVQDVNSPSMEHLTMFHDHILMINILIIMLGMYISISISWNKIINRTMMQNQFIELIWTFIPMIILIFMVFPSIKILYLKDELFSLMMTVKYMGHQWYWSYEYLDFNNIEFDLFMIPTEELNKNEFRLLEVSNRMIVPFNTQIRLLISSVNVIHSWTIPAMGIKVYWRSISRVNMM